MLVMIVDAIRPPRTAIEVVIPEAESAAGDAVPRVDAERDATQKELVGV